MSRQKHKLETLLSSPLSRRSTLGILGLGAASLSLPRCSWLNPKSESEPTLAESIERSMLTEISPMDRTLGDHGPAAFSGDNPMRPHRYLRSGNSRTADVEEKVPLAVIGGGLSGLFSTYLLREHNPVFLEQAPRFGGNAKGESWRGVDYGTGSAYFMEQDEGSQIFNLFSELGIHSICRKKTQDDPVAIGQKRFAEFWSGETDPSRKDQFVKLKRYFLDVFNCENGQTLPEIPARTAEELALVKSLDTIDFLTHLTQVNGGPLHHHIHSAIEHYCWSTFGSSMSELSTATALNCYAAEFGECYVAPGGNGGVAEQILRRIAGAVDPGNLRAGCVVTSVDAKDDGVLVTYVDSAEKVRTLHARAVVIACPKFVAARIIRDLEPKRIAAIQKLNYRAYLVANVLLKSSIPADFYDLYLLGDGSPEHPHPEKASTKQRVTDVVLSTFVHHNPDRTVLTLFRGMPFDGARSMMFSNSSHAMFKKEFENQIAGTILPIFGKSPSDVQDVRLSRWGHAMPVAGVGLIADGTVDLIRAPFRDRVFFVQQDNWAYPCIETAAEEAIAIAPQVTKVLG